MCFVRFVDVYVRFGVNITPADLLVAGVFTTMHALCFDLSVLEVSHCHFHICTLFISDFTIRIQLYPWGLGLCCCFVLPRWSVEEFHTPSIFLLHDRVSVLRCVLLR